MVAGLSPVPAGSWYPTIPVMPRLPSAHGPVTIPVSHGIPYPVPVIASPPSSPEEERADADVISQSMATLRRAKDLHDRCNATLDAAYAALERRRELEEALREFMAQIQDPDPR